MNIVNGLYERITDFENILEATKGKSYNEAFKWRGKNYNSFKELLNDYCKLENCCEEDKFYRQRIFYLKSILSKIFIVCLLMIRR
jgi:hypothetical protein